MSHLRDPNNRKYDLDQINPNWLTAIDVYLDRLSQYYVGGKPICIISLFMKYNYQPVWFNNIQGIYGWWDDEAWPYVKVYISEAMRLIRQYEDKIDFIIEICNEPTAEMRPMITEIFNHLISHYTGGYVLDLNDIIPGYQKFKKVNNKTFTKPKAWKDFKGQYTEPFAKRIDEECPGVVHQFFKLNIIDGINNGKNVHVANKIYYWSTDGDKKLNGGTGSELRPGQNYFNKLIQIFRNTKKYGKDKNPKTLWENYFKHSFFECFTYKNEDACLYLAKAHYTAFGEWPNKLKKQSDGIPEIPEIPEVPEVPGPEKENEKMKDKKWYQKLGKFLWKHLKMFFVNLFSQWRALYLGIGLLIGIILF